MTFTLPKTSEELIGWEWSNIEPGYQELEKTTVTAGNVKSWLSGWSRVSECVDELYNRLYIAASINTVDEICREKVCQLF